MIKYQSIALWKPWLITIDTWHMKTLYVLLVQVQSLYQMILSRLQTGMRGAYGKAHGTAARVRIGQILLSVRSHDKFKAEVVEALRRSKFDRDQEYNPFRIWKIQVQKKKKIVKKWTEKSAMRRGEAPKGYCHEKLWILELGVEVLSGNMVKTSTCRSFIQTLVKTSTCRSFIQNWVKTST